MRITKKHRQFSPLLSEIYSRAYQKASVDELNKVYVALTRARYEMYIFVPAKSGNSHNMARYLIPENPAEYGSREIYPAKAKAETIQIKGQPNQDCDWVGFLKDEFRLEHTLRRRGQVLQGNILHAMLSKIGEVNKDNLDSQIDRAKEFCFAGFPAEKNLPSYGDKLKELISCPELKKFFYSTGAKVFCEKEVVNSFGDTKRIDRLIVSEKEIWVIDYKSSRSEATAGHQKQVREYMAIVGQIYPGKTAKGYLIYLDAAQVEEIVLV
jgi:ATP-dependent exoDNAse (exonuclease V) beta subunit